MEDRIIRPKEVSFFGLPQATAFFWLAKFFGLFTSEIFLAPPCLTAKKSMTGSATAANIQPDKVLLLKEVKICITLFIFNVLIMRLSGILRI